MKEFPEKFIFGTATAATQIEGGDKNSNWYTWSKKGKIKDNESSIVAADHYNRVKEDIAIMKTLNQESYRMSVEWSRIVPREGVVSRVGIDHYIAELKLLREENIVPLITLHHFSIPQWVEDKGGWLSNDAIYYFLDFVRIVVTEFGDLCSEYCTINEPNVYCLESYMDGKYPPGHRGNMFGYIKASRNLIKAHLKSYKMIHKIRKEKNFLGETRVGFAHHLAVVEPISQNPLTVYSRHAIDYVFHTIFSIGFIEGRLVFPLGNEFPEGAGIFCDFIGVNYYSRHLIKSSWNPITLFGDVHLKRSHPKETYSDLGWQIYPEGLGEVSRSIYKEYPIPIYITENGIADATDSQRGEFIEKHLEVVHDLIDEGINVERYYHWSLLDNLEWHEGYHPRFGLVHINYKTLKRTIRKSGHYYAKIIEKRKLIPWKKFNGDKHKNREENKYEDKEEK